MWVCLCCYSVLHTSFLGHRSRAFSPLRRRAPEPFCPFPGSKQGMEPWGNAGNDCRVCLQLFFYVSGLGKKHIHRRSAGHSVLCLFDWLWSHQVTLGEHFACNHSLLYTAVIYIFAVIVCFLISLLFLVNCYLKPQYLYLIIFLPIVSLA